MDVEWDCVNDAMLFEMMDCLCERCAFSLYMPNVSTLVNILEGYENSAAIQCAVNNGH